MYGMDPPPERLDLSDGGLEIVGRRHVVLDGVDLRAEVDRDDVSALCGERDSMASALTARGSGDKDDAPI
ncbi:hypothetical protein A2U19_02810 [Dietzia maris]|nr:hypothetical protein A2U19_02810 [Dietzia maris]